MRLISYNYCKTCEKEEVFDIGSLDKPNMGSIKEAASFAQHHSTHKMISTTMSYEGPEDVEVYISKGIITKELLDKIADELIGE
jgi:hypothetical protein